tara:strand:- start:42530 stop:44404 length:1875 start_codon:yes stop_codon:yes gene_type:complete
MIIATAGHVDHGKTALIKALTGQHTDRTAEEQRRGMSIELGYAWLDCPDGSSLDLVDVPGHEKFMRTLLAGMGCVDAVMLVVAADDGIMPQTQEHLQVMRLLGISSVLVVISKCAAVTRQRAEQVQNEVLQHLATTGVLAPPAFMVDSLSGAGIVELLAQLHTWAGTSASAQDQRPARLRPARLSIDRHFSQPGAGDIVTGTLLSGSVKIGDNLRLSDNGSHLRVRGIQIHGQALKTAKAGQRCALNLSGDLAGAELGRGSQLLDPGIFAPTTCLDSRLDLSGALPNRSTLQLHMGNAVINARWVPLKGEQLPSDRHYAQWILEQSVCCRHGERFIIRDPASRQLLGSGQVIDPFALSKGRQRPERLAALMAMDEADTDQSLKRLLAALPDGVDLPRFMLSRHLTSEPALVKQKQILRRGNWLCLAADFDHCLQRLTTELAVHHQHQPQQTGMTRPQLARQLGLPINSRLLAAAVRHALDGRSLRQSGAALHLPEHQPRPDPETLGWLQQVLPHFSACAPRPPVIGELISELTLDKAELLARLDRLCALGLLVRIGRNRYLLPQSIDHLLALAAELAAHSSDGRFSTAAFRDHSGIGRNHSVAVLEYFDKAGFTRHIGEQRRLI